MHQRTPGSLLAISWSEVLPPPVPGRASLPKSKFTHYRVYRLYRVGLLYARYVYRYIDFALEIYRTRAFGLHPTVFSDGNVLKSCLGRQNASFHNITTFVRRR